MLKANEAFLGTEFIIVNEGQAFTHMIEVLSRFYYSINQVVLGCDSFAHPLIPELKEIVLEEFTLPHQQLLFLPEFIKLFSDKFSIGFG